MADKGHLFAIGGGYVARALSRALSREGYTISGTTRSADRRQALHTAGISPILWSPDMTPTELQPLFPETVTHILISTPPDEHGCPAAQLGDLMARLPALVQVHYVSSSAVYGNHEGGWVDETAPLRATTPRGLARISAERFWHDWCKTAHIPLTIHRLSGIYGPGRNAVVTLRKRNSLSDPQLGQRIFKPGQVFNRIHVADIVAVLKASFLKWSVRNAGTDKGGWAADIFNHADDMPAPPQDVIAYAAALLDLPEPPLIPFEEARMSPMGRSFYADNKRVVNRKIKMLLGGSSLQFPTYREGLKAIFDNPATESGSTSYG